jgi:acyl dehydratase
MAAEKFPIEAGHIMMFARAIGDANPIYYDAHHAATTEVGAVIAPPTFVQASAQFDPNYFLRPKIGEEWFGSAKEATGLSSRSGDGGSSASSGGLHAEQHYVYHKPLQAGDTLVATTKPGKSWEKEGKRGGKLSFSETVTEYHDQSGELVVTATSLGVRTERPATSTDDSATQA